MTNDQIYSTVVTWLERILPTTTIMRGYQGGDYVPGAVVIHMTGTANVRTHEQFINAVHGDTGDVATGDFYPAVMASPVIEREWRFMLTCYGDKDDATEPLRIIDAARRLAGSGPALGSPLEPDFGIHDCGPIVQIGATEENGWQQQANMTLTLRGITQDAFEIDIISDIEGIRIERI